MKNKKKSIKTIKVARVWQSEQWTVCFGKLNPGPGHPGSVQSLFRIVGEKLPFDSLRSVNQHLKKEGLPRTGVYVAHDSMGFARYIGRGSIFSRLRNRLKAQILELKYYSFYVVEEKKHEREIETLLIRAAGPLLQFNTKKKRLTISHGNVLDYEAGTRFFERHYKKGKKKTRT
jgi:hypothetical protein